MSPADKTLEMVHKVSVIIPTYNSQDTILTTLDSIKKQTYKNYECIIIDDHSRDQTISIVTNFIKNDRKFSIYSRNDEKKGANACRNEGLKLSTGDFIIFMDADDFLSPFCFEIRSKKMLENPDVDMGIFNTMIVRKKSKLYTRYTINPIKGFLTGNYPWQTMSPIWKRNFLLFLNGFDEDFPRLQDVELHSRALLAEDFRYQYFPFTKVDSYYVIDNTIHPVSEDKTKRQIIGFIKYIEKMLLILKKDRKKRYLKKMYYLLIKEVSGKSIDIDTKKRIEALGKKLRLNTFEQKRIELFVKLNDKEIIKKKYLFEILFLNSSRISDYFNKIIFTLVHKFIS